MANTVPREPDHLPALGSRDRALVESQVLLTRESRPLLYGAPPPDPDYRRGTLPELEAALPELSGGARAGLATAMALMGAVSRLPSRAWDGVDRDESAVLASGAATPLERARLLAALCLISGIAARICLLYRDTEPRLHAVCELAIMGSWAVFDPLANQPYLVTHHPYASAWDLKQVPAIAGRHPEHGRKPTIDASFYRTIGIAALMLPDPTPS